MSEKKQMNFGGKADGQDVSTGLIEVNEKRYVSIWSRMKFNRIPTLPLRVKDIPKISIDWLAEQVPDNMLRQIEKERLKQNGEKVEDMYVPDSRIPIYLFFQKCDQKEDLNDEYRYKKYEYDYEDENGLKCKVIVDGIDYPRIEIIQKGEASKKYALERHKRLTSFNYDDIKFKEFIEVIEYAKFLDNIFGNNFMNEFFIDLHRGMSKNCYGYYEEQNPLNEFVKEIVYLFRISTYTTPLKISPIYDALRANYRKLKKEYSRNEFEVFGENESRREKFYEKNNSRNQFRQQYRLEENEEQATEQQAGNQQITNISIEDNSDGR